MSRRARTGTLDRSDAEPSDGATDLPGGLAAIGGPPPERRSAAGRRLTGQAPSAGANRAPLTLPPSAVAVGGVGGLSVVAGLWLVERTGQLEPSAALVALVAVVAVTPLVELLRRSLDRAAAAGVEIDDLRRRAERDPVTGLLNRAAITGELARRLERRQPGEMVAALVCDLDRFRRINDTAGHAVGDEVLRLAAARLVDSLRPSESVGRLSADEYLIVTSGLPAIRDLEILAERVVDVLDRPMDLGDGSTQVVGGRVGVAFAVGERRPADAEAPIEPAALVADAGLARSRAKADGWRLAVADRADRALARARQELELDLRAAIADRRLTVHYQPVVDVDTGRVDRLEALVRWHDGDRGTLLPGQFLPVAAEAGLLGELDRLVLDQACRQAVAWSASVGRPITVSVNVSASQLLDGGLVDVIAEVLTLTGLPAAQLQLEVGAAPVLERLDRALVVLRRLDLLGVDVAIDDLGVGVVDPVRLRALPMISTVKIDRSLVAGIDDDPVASTAIGAVIALAAALGVSVVAEGVETATQARALADLGADRLQGHLFARPAPGPAIVDAFEVDHRHRW